MMIHHDPYASDLLDALDDEIPYPGWMEADLYSDEFADELSLDDESLSL